MALLGNYSVLNKNPGRFLAGTSLCDRSNWNTSGSQRNFYYNDGGDFNTAGGYINTHPLFYYGIPLGMVPPYSWFIPQKAGGMAMRTTGSGEITATLIPQYPMISALTGSGELAATILGLGNIICALTGSGSFSADITAAGNVVISFTGVGGLTATITGDGYVTIGMTGSGILSGALSTLLNMVAAMTGSGTLAADASLLVSMLCDMSGGGTLTASITGQKEMVASMTGSGNLAADINAFAEMILGLIGSGSLNAGTGAIAYMSIDMTVTGSSLSTSNVAAAVWNALASDFDTPGTMGEKAGTGGGLSQQEVRDAMTLPATDPVQPGSVDTKLNVITALSS